MYQDDYLLENRHRLSRSSPTKLQPDPVQHLIAAWDTKTPAEQQAALTSLSLRTLAGVLTLPDNGDFRLIKLKQDTAKFTISNQVKLDEQALKLNPHRADRTEEIFKLAEDMGLLDGLNESSQSTQPSVPVPDSPETQDSPALTPPPEAPVAPTDSLVMSPVPEDLKARPVPAKPIEQGAFIGPHMLPPRWHEPDQAEPHFSNLHAAKRYYGR
jgi:hypothetical protein